MSKYKTLLLLLFLPSLILSQLTEQLSPLNSGEPPSNDNNNNVFERSDLPSPRMVIIGPTAVGKSSLANALLGFDPEQNDVLFEVCSSMDSCTKSASYKTGNWLGNGPNFTIVDTPGIGDSDGEDPIIINEITTFLKDDLKHAEVLILLLNGDNIRFDEALQSMLHQYTTIFGEQWWDHMIIGVSFWEFDKSSIRKRQRKGRDEAWYKAEMQQQINQKFDMNRTFEFAFLHSLSQTDYNLDNSDEQENWIIETSKLWRYATSFSSMNKTMEFKDVDDLLEDNIRLKREVKKLNGIIEQNIKELKQDMDVNLANLTKNYEELKQDLDNKTSHLTNLGTSLQNLFNRKSSHCVYRHLGYDSTRGLVTFTSNLLTSGSGTWDLTYSKFTIPFTGVYSITWGMVTVMDNGERAYFVLWVDGQKQVDSQYNSQYDGPSGVVRDQGSRTVLLYLVQGSQVGLWLDHNSANVFYLNMCITFI